MDHYVFVTLSMKKYDLYGLYGSVCMEAMMILYEIYVWKLVLYGIARICMVSPRIPLVEILMITNQGY